MFKFKLVLIVYVQFLFMSNHFFQSKVLKKNKISSFGEYPALGYIQCIMILVLYYQGPSFESTIKKTRAIEGNYIA